jgi:hypothetical protein
LCEFKESWTGLHVADLMDDDHALHPAPGGCPRYFTKKMEKARIVRLQAKSAELIDQIGVWDGVGLADVEQHGIVQRADI